MSFFKGAFSPAAAAKVSSDWIPANVMAGAFMYSEDGTSEEAALQNSYYFGCVRAISEDLAKMPRHIFLKVGEGREPVSGHQSSVCLSREANNIQTSYQFFNCTQRNAITKGNGYAELQFDKKTGNVIAMWPIPSNRVSIELRETSKEELSIFYNVTLPDGKTKRLNKYQVLHIAGVGFDGVQGYPMHWFMSKALGLSKSLEEYQELFFKQGAGLQGYISVPDTFSEEQIRNLRIHMANTNEGLQNAHRLKFLYESSKFNAAGATPEQGQTKEAREFQGQEIARFNRTPLSKLQDLTKGTSYTSLEALNLQHVSDALSPWVINWEEEINRKFFTVEEKLFVKFNMNGLLRGDALSRSNYYRTMVFSKLMNPNEARALEDLAPYEGGDEFLMPLNMGVGNNEGIQSKRSLDASERVQD